MIYCGSPCCYKLLECWKPEKELWLPFIHESYITHIHNILQHVSIIPLHLIHATENVICNCMFRGMDCLSYRLRESLISNVSTVLINQMIDNHMNKYFRLLRFVNVKLILIQKKNLYNIILQSKLTNAQL